MLMHACAMVSHINECRVHELIFSAMYMYMHTTIAGILVCM